LPFDSERPARDKPSGVRNPPIEVRPMWFMRVAASVPLLILAVALMGALPGPGEMPQPGSLAGQLLIAAPAMNDPRLAETVILMVRQDKTGAFGIVINRPVEERSLASLLEAMGVNDAAARGSVRIFAGGPVEPAIGFVLHSADYHRPETLAIDGHVALTSSAAILRDIGHGVGPAKLLLAFGYAGWAPGQLEAEMASHDWFTELEDPKLVFDDDRAIVWKEALERRSRAL
jgi:putative transcriptional regulator